MTHEQANGLLHLASLTLRRAERTENFDLAINAHTAMRRIMHWLYTHKEQE